ncbi:MAG: site-specific DNA-methyltransferase [Sulfurospirillum sp.]|nr:site-specific DNA-methyltransferase [Sulfurospirillum sp.]
MKKNIIEEQTINDNNYQKLKELFPHAVSIDEDGKYIIDKEKLQMSLDPSKAEIKEDGYGLNWVGKKEAYHGAFTKNYKVLKPLQDDSKNWDETENVLIKGDNLDALKILRHNYFEVIKMIYIDPPYNTKNDGFVYNDNFTSNTEQTLEELGYDKEYIDYIENIQGAKTHSGWLSFMYPRLLLARDLLKDDGVIFISIDDKEQAQLKLLCDDIFGGDNLIGLIPVIMNLKGNQDNFGFADTHEYLFCYAKNKELCNIGKFDIDEDEIYEEWTEDDYGLYKKADGLRRTGDDAPREKRQKGWFPVFITDEDKVYVTEDDKPLSANDTVVYPINDEGEELSWSWSKAKIINDNHNLIVTKGRNGNKTIYKKQRPEIGDLPTKKPKSFFYKADYSTSTATTQLKNLMEKKLFKSPKPVPFIKDLLTIGMNADDTILDFFAGSGTTAHAVMDLNAKDGGNRKYICVQWAEETPLKSEARKAGYETIFDITKARIDKAGEKILGEAKASLPKEQTLFSGDEVPTPLDVGFRTFEVVEDAKQCIYQKSLDTVTQEDLFVCMSKSHIQSNEEILYNLFVAENLPLSVKYETLIQNKLYLASNVAFVLGDMTSNQLVAALKNKKECEYITVYSPNISNDSLTLEIESNISKLGIKPDKLRFRG